MSLKTPEEWGWVDLVSHEIAKSTSFYLIFFFLFSLIYSKISFDLFFNSFSCFLWIFHVLFLQVVLKS